MPLVQVSLLKGKTAEEERNLLTGITGCVVESINVGSASVRVIIDEIDPEHWSVAGIPFSERNV
ncbi:MAG: 4-oxalocrotonate tautomerase [Acidimicrobiaceae bacterium]|nr:4-oxalocrotonate tautomerase [Acidimicrobiaceae bacterium]